MIAHKMNHATASRPKGNNMSEANQFRGVDSELRCNVCGKSIQYGDKFYEYNGVPVCDLSCITDIREMHWNEIWNGEMMQETHDPWYKNSYRSAWKKLIQVSVEKKTHPVMLN